MTAMSIGRLARKAGVGVETIRFYERKGLIEQPARPRDGGYRVYPEETAHRIRFIRQAQELGFSLREVQDLLSLRTDPEADSRDVRARAAAKLAEVKRKITELERIRAALEDLIAACPGRGALRNCSIMETLRAGEATCENHPGGEGLRS